MNKYIYALAAVATVSATQISTAQVAAIRISASVASQSTNYTETLSISQFDSTLGTLTGVEIQLTGVASGSVSLESLDAFASTVTSIISATVSIDEGPGSLSGSVTSSASQSTNLSAFDMMIDFSGTSGSISPNVIAASSSDTFSVDAADFSLYIGTGDVSFDISAIGSSSATGAGNLISQFATNASAEVAVIYTFEAIPEPSSTALLGLGGIAFLARRRR